MLKLPKRWKKVAFIGRMRVGTPEDLYSTPLDPIGDGSFKGCDGAILYMPPPDRIEWHWTTEES